MKNSKVKGTPVISIAEGRQLGTIERVYFDPASRKVVGFVVHESGGLMTFDADRAGLVEVSQVHSLGPDALMVDDTSKVQGGDTEDQNPTAIDLDTLMSRKAVTESGTQVGAIASVDFDEHTFALRSVEVSPGFFHTNRDVPVDQIISIGEDVVVVHDSVSAPEPEATPAGESDRAQARVVINRKQPDS